MPSIDLKLQHRQVLDEIKAARKKLKPSASFDSDFWSSKADLLAKDSERVELYSTARFREYQDRGGELSRERWEDTDSKGRDLLLQSIALAQQI